MIFDLICIVLIILGFIKGYNKGLVSSILRLGAMAAAFLLALYVNSHMLIIPTPLGLWGQGAIIFVVIVIFANSLINLIDFEEIIVLGFISRILGGLLHAIIVAAILVCIMAIGFTVGGNELLNEFPFAEGSMVVEKIQELLLQFPINGILDL